MHIIGFGQVNGNHPARMAGSDVFFSNQWIGVAIFEELKAQSWLVIIAVGIYR